MGILEKFSLQDRVALVSGGSGPQFGSSITEALAEAGATVISASRSIERNQAFTNRLREEGYDAHAMQLDITDPQSIENLGCEILNRFGRLDILVTVPSLDAEVISRNRLTIPGSSVPVATCQGCSPCAKPISPPW